MPTTKEIFEMINAALSQDPSKAGGMQAVYQFNVTGEDAGTYQIILTPDSAKAVEGEQESSNCTLEINSDDFKEMMAGNLNGTAAFMSGKLKVTGDMGLAMRLQQVLEVYQA
ncbi:SCP2 sterol-binding domain-containing protein [Alicyclobacillus tolerans]|uniref:SCP2 sterol-binding domain-containing protein n=1 Tax=Alicyclobacillus tolerans TaxID=90970 RepID=UPI001F2A3F3F|nr:SCP2 sterol-binding domain-containing protein [Alicyclobacillus tolerans]MCF8563813.1 SCP2 sterol-binding domain-containing protein [Alicyclobacillus tolerans]